MTCFARHLTDGNAYLDRPIWHALRTRQSHFCVSRRDTVMFRPEVSHFGATAPGDHGNPEGLVDLLGQSVGCMVFMQTEAFDLPDMLRCTRHAEGLQMVLASAPAERAMPGICTLGDADVPDMLRLVELTEPGPFRPRTVSLGTYLGLRHKGQLIAMAGERLKLPGFTEISAVCVHPDHRGSGLAQTLVKTLIHLILSRKETPMLHLYRDNLAARALYEGLGFQVRAKVHIQTVENRFARTAPQKKPMSRSSLHILGG
ncbi:MAG: GNAT family N-acetyltransferase [Pseudomonadota bacterium]